MALNLLALRRHPRTSAAKATVLDGSSPGRDGRLSRALALLLALATGGLAASGPALAQSQTFMLKPGSKVGPASKLKTTNCVTNPADGSVTCDTKVENAPGDTPAKPSYSPFKP